jgi:hypothetical protein
MDSYVLTLYDDAGHPIPIPAIQGVGIKDIHLKSEGDDADVYEIVLDDERVFAFYVRHGKTPEKGVDYWTESDKSGIVADVLAALPTWEGGSY